MNGVPVEMAERTAAGPKNLASTRTDPKGLARFCDAPLHAVDIVVGYDVCGSVWVRDVAPVWPSVRRVVVTYVEEWCDHFSFKNRCQFLLRVRDEMGVAITSALFNGNLPMSGGEVTDVFGRVFGIVKIGETLEGAVSKEGYRPVRVSKQCTASGDEEVLVVLPKR